MCYILLYFIRTTEFPYNSSLLLLQDFLSIKTCDKIILYINARAKVRLQKRKKREDKTLSNRLKANV